MRRSHAFTLVELLVVISIIALLMALLFPALTRVKDLAKTAACTSNLRQIGTAIHSYVGDFSGRLPVADEWTEGPLNNQLEVWFYVLGAYMNTPTVGPQNWPQCTHKSSLSWLMCPANPLKPGEQPNSVTSGYGWNGIGFGHAGGITPPITLTRANRLLSEVPRPARIIIVGDSCDATAYPGTPHTVWACISISTPLDGFDLNKARRHQNGANYLFCDGHVEKIKTDIMLASGNPPGWSYFYPKSMELFTWDKTYVPWMP